MAAGALTPPDLASLSVSDWVEMLNQTMGMVVTALNMQLSIGALQQMIDASVKTIEWLAQNKTVLLHAGRELSQRLFGQACQTGIVPLIQAFMRGGMQHDSNFNTRFFHQLGQRTQLSYSGLALLGAEGHIAAFQALVRSGDIHLEMLVKEDLSVFIAALQQGRYTFFETCFLKAPTLLMPFSHEVSGMAELSSAEGLGAEVNLLGFAMETYPHLPEIALNHILHRVFAEQLARYSAEQLQARIRCVDVLFETLSPLQRGIYIDHLVVLDHSGKTPVIRAIEAQDEEGALWMIHHMEVFSDSVRLGHVALKSMNGKILLALWEHGYFRQFSEETAPFPDPNMSFWKALITNIFQQESPIVLGTEVEWYQWVSHVLEKVVDSHALFGTEETQYANMFYQYFIQRPFSAPVDYRVLEMMLARGVDINGHLVGGQSPGSTALMHAVYLRQDPELVRWLVAHGASPHLRMPQSSPDAMPPSSVDLARLSKRSAEMLEALGQRDSSSTTLKVVGAVVALGGAVMAAVCCCRRRAPLPVRPVADTDLQRGPLRRTRAPASAANGRGTSSPVVHAASVRGDVARISPEDLIHYRTQLAEALEALDRELKKQFGLRNTQERAGSEIRAKRARALELLACGSGAAMQSYLEDHHQTVERELPIVLEALNMETKALMAHKKEAGAVTHSAKSLFAETNHSEAAGSRHASADTAGASLSSTPALAQSGQAVPVTREEAPAQFGMVRVAGGLWMAPLDHRSNLEQPFLHRDSVERFYEAKYVALKTLLERREDLRNMPIRNRRDQRALESLDTERTVQAHAGFYKSFSFQAAAEERIEAFRREKMEASEERLEHSEQHDLSLLCDRLIPELLGYLDLDLSHTASIMVCAELASVLRVIQIRTRDLPVSLGFFSTLLAIRNQVFHEPERVVVRAEEGGALEFRDVPPQQLAGCLALRATVASSASAFASRAVISSQYGTNTSLGAMGTPAKLET